MGLELAAVAVNAVALIWELARMYFLTIRDILTVRPLTAVTPKAIAEKLNAELARVRALPEIRERLISLAAELNAMTPDQLGNRLRAPYRRWRRLSSMAG